MALRMIPYGYRMEDGRLEIEPQETETVRWIFTSYLSGRLLSEIAQILTERGEPYLPGNAIWNKNKIARIIENNCHAISIPEQKLHAAICRGLSQAIENREDVMQLILSNLSYAITGNDNIPDAYVIEQKIKETQGDLLMLILRQKSIIRLGCITV